MNPPLSTHNQSFTKSVADFFIPFQRFGRWLIQNWITVLIVQILAFGLAIRQYLNTPESIHGQAILSTGWLPTSDLKGFFENLRDAEIQNKLDDFWLKESNLHDGNELKNVKFLLSKSGGKKSVDIHSFQVSFEQNKVEPTTITEKRLINAMDLQLKSRSDIQQIIYKNLLLKRKLDLQKDGLQLVIQELAERNVEIKHKPILSIILKDIQHQSDSLARRSDLDISIASISTQSQVNSKPSILIFLLIEASAGLFFFIRFLLKGY